MCDMDHGRWGFPAGWPCPGRHDETYNARMPASTTPFPGDAALLWLPLWPLLPACTGPVTGATLLLAAVLCTGAATFARQRRDPCADTPGFHLIPVLAAAGLAGLIALLLRAFAPALHLQVAAALPMLVLCGLPFLSQGGDLPRVQRMWPALLLAWGLACIHAALQHGGLALEWRLLSDPAGRAAAALPWRSPAASLVALALLLAAVGAIRNAVARRQRA